MFDLRGFQKRRDLSVIQIPKRIQEMIQRRWQGWFVREEFSDDGDNPDECVSDTATSAVRLSRIECPRSQGKG